MHFHELFSEVSLWLGLLLGVALVLLVLIATRSAAAPARGGGEGADEHGSAPIPLVLKVLYTVFALWAAGYCFWVILSGVKI